MKVICVLSLILLVSSSPNISLDNVKMGQPCQSNGGFTITSYSVTPFPPSGCNAQAVTMQGTFKVDACPHVIYIHEIYNQQHVYNQMIRVEGCYNSGQNATFVFNVNPFQCNPGGYFIQTSLQAQDQNRNFQILACWQYEYNF